MKSNALALIFGALGGIAGYFAFFWIVTQGFYALVLPGALVGLAASHFKSRSIVVCVACGLMALAFGLCAQWKFSPLRGESFLHYLTQIHRLGSISIIMIAAGTVMGFWFPFAHRNDGIAPSR